MLLVAAGLQNIARLDPDNLELSTAIQLHFKPPLKWSKESARAIYEEWVLRNGFRDSIEALVYVLEDAHRVLAIWKLLADRGQQMEIAGAEWNRVILAGEQNIS